MFTKLQPDITYMRFYKDGHVLRVARAVNGLVTALYPTVNKNRFNMEAFRKIAGVSVPILINRKSIDDTVMLRLLDGEKTEDILKDCQECAGYHVNLPVSVDDNFRRLELPMFRIADDKQEPAAVGK